MVMVVATSVTFMLSGPIGGGWGGNVVTLPCGSHDIDIRISVPEADAIFIHCRVWADDNNLRAAKFSRAQTGTAIGNATIPAIGLSGGDIVNMDVANTNSA